MTTKTKVATTPVGDFVQTGSDLSGKKTFLRGDQESLTLSDTRMGAQKEIITTNAEGSSDTRRGSNPYFLRMKRAMYSSINLGRI